MSETMPSFNVFLWSVTSRKAQDVLTDVVEHHLVVDGRDAEQTDDGPDRGDVVLVAEGVATVALDGGIDGRHGRLRCEELGRVGVVPGVAALVEDPRRRVHHQ